MNLSLKSTQLEDAHIVIPGSKSESNRLLILGHFLKSCLWKIYQILMTQIIY